jgi:hypothetical protein
MSNSHKNPGIDNIKTNNCSQTHINPKKKFASILFGFGEERFFFKAGAWRRWTSPASGTGAKKKLKGVSFAFIPLLSKEVAPPSPAIKEDPTSK